MYRHFKNYHKTSKMAGVLERYQCSSFYTLETFGTSCSPLATRVSFDTYARNIHIDTNKVNELVVSCIHRSNISKGIQKTMLNENSNGTYNVTTTTHQRIPHNYKNNYGRQPYNHMSYYGFLSHKVDILRRTKVSRQRQTVKVRTYFTVVHWNYVEEQHETDEEDACRHQAYPDERHLLLPVVRAERHERQKRVR